MKSSIHAITSLPPLCMHDCSMSIPKTVWRCQLTTAALVCLQASFFVLASHLVGLFFTQRLRSKIPDDVK